MRSGFVVLALVVACCPTAALATGPASGSYRVLQINMCNSGAAPCYTGGAGAGAVELIKNRQPSVVTLNEVCRRDLGRIRRGTGYVGVFAQAGSRLCRNGSPFGNAVVLPAGTRLGRATITQYARQDPDIGGERRTLICVPAAGVTACVTHLSDGPARFPQAAQMASVVARHAARGPTVLGGDWNIAFPEAQRHVPDRMFRKGDGAVQHIMATDGFGFVGSRNERMAWTDHPAFQVDLRRLTMGRTS